MEEGSVLSKATLTIKSVISVIATAAAIMFIAVLTVRMLLLRRLGCKGA